ncbi:hypothetical protein NQT62_03655 [Limnobacter humi]|uniref:Uncharacterized protein n=1 Tax=Limnobacter humi TaxID=1778671 RepID=A0ABT1WES4_9BURK|nr:hypothetical protein [Limnobacter humi]MCQ8895536.1 hypothetical protein [Limnobacter humi]
MPVTGPEPDRTQHRAEYEAYWKNKLQDYGIPPVDFGTLTIDPNDPPSEGDIAKISCNFGETVVRDTMRNLQDVVNRFSV